MGRMKFAATQTRVRAGGLARIFKEISLGI